MMIDPSAILNPLIEAQFRAHTAKFHELKLTIGKDAQRTIKIEMMLHHAAFWKLRNALRYLRETGASY